MFDTEPHECGKGIGPVAKDELQEILEYEGITTDPFVIAVPGWTNRCDVCGGDEVVFVLCLGIEADAPDDISDRPGRPAGVSVRSSRWMGRLLRKRPKKPVFLFRAH